MDVVMLSSIPLMQVLKNPVAIHRKARRICKIGMAGIIITKQMTSYGEKDFAIVKDSQGAEAIMKAINKAYVKENEDRLCEQTSEALLAGNLEEAQRINDIIFGVDRELLSKKAGRKPANKGRKAVAPIEARAELAAPTVFENNASMSIMGATSADFGGSVLTPLVDAVVQPATLHPEVVDSVSGVAAMLKQPAAFNTENDLPTLNDFHQALSGNQVDSLLGQVTAQGDSQEPEVVDNYPPYMGQEDTPGDSSDNDLAKTWVDASPPTVDDPLKDLVMIPPTRPQPKLDPSLERISENLRAKGFKPWHSR